MAEMESALIGGNKAERALHGVLFLGGLELAYNVYGGTNSSPQTTEVFGGGERSASLMKWVTVAGIKCGIYAFLASLISRSWWPIIGVGTGTVAMHALYVHANRCALEREAAGGPTGMPKQDGPKVYRTNGPIASPVPVTHGRSSWR